MTFFFHPGFLFFWIVSSWLIGLLGKNKKFGFAGNFLISFLFSPIVGVLVLLASEPPSEKKPRRSKA